MAEEIQVLKKQVQQLAAERDAAVAERNKAREQVIVQQQARAKMTRTIDEVRQKNRDADAERQKRHEERLASLESGRLATVKKYEEKIAALQSELDELRKSLEVFPAKSEADAPAFNSG